MAASGGDTADAIWDDPFQRHDFLGAQHARNERRLLIVIALTLATMVVEIVAGHRFGSMALLADGWHMATHAGALSVGAVAYGYARRRVSDQRFVFGTGKVGDLAGFTSAILLGGVSLWIAWESVQRLVDPGAIRFDEALLVATIGFVVNVVSAWLLHPGGGHAHGERGPSAHGHGHGGHGHGGHDHGGHDQHEHARHAEDANEGDHHAVSRHGAPVTSHGQASTEHGPPVPPHGCDARPRGEPITGHGLAGTGHGYPVTDHGRAVTDHGPAVSDHGRTVTDRGRAVTDHSRAMTDHGHAVTDHGHAVTNHGPAVTGHGRAVAGHGDVHGAGPSRAALAGHGEAVAGDGSGRDGAREVRAARARAAQHHDHNLRGAYLHVVADALTSLIAIGALLLGRAYGWEFLDALGGLVGALVIARWSVLLLRDTSGVLLDLEKDPALAREVRERLEQEGDRVVDLHVWRVGPGHYAAIASVLARVPHAPAHYKARLAAVPGLTHVTIEVTAR